jgi:hypothetical protein
VDYLLLTTSTELPDISALHPFKAVVIVEDTVTPDRQAEISQWLVDEGCLYMMAWGEACRSWEESVDLANLETFDFGEIPDDRLIVTTWHADESLKDVFWFAKHTAMHPCFPLNKTVLLHLAPMAPMASKAREKELTDEFAGA